MDRDTDCTHRLYCDGKSPACSQCTLRRLSCPGYQRDFQFVSAFSGAGKQAELKDQSKTIPAYQKCMPAGTDNTARHTQVMHVVSRVGEPTLLQLGNHQGLEDDIHYILQHYAPLSSSHPAEFNPFHNQICGAWVEALPYVFTTEENNAFLFFAIKTLATSLRCLSPTSKASKTYAFEMYCKSLSLMGETIEEAQGSFQMEHCVAIMCLAISGVSSFFLRLVIAHAVNDLLQR